MSDELPGITLPCGCYRGIVKRLAPDIDENGHAKLDKDGGILMTEQEDLQETHCPEHSKVIIERQQEVMRAIESGADPDEAIALLMGSTSLALTDGKEPA